jgi:fructose-specific phosphotransferase system IIC component
VLFSILGGFLGGILVLLIPALLRVDACEYTGWKKYLLIGGFGSLFVTGTTGAVLSVLGYD